MNKTIINSKPFQLAVRIFGLFTAVLLILTTSLKFAEFAKNDFFANNPEEKIGYIISISVNVLVIIIGIIMAIKPSAYFLIGVASFIYSVLIASANPLYYMNIPMLFLTIGILLCSDFTDSASAAAEAFFLPEQDKSNIDIKQKRNICRNFFFIITSVK